MSIYVIIAILAFGILIAVHEFGHFSAAKLLGVKVTEFAIGFGPKLLKKQGKETLYTLRALPFGGYCTMEGQDVGMDDPRAFTSQRRWRRCAILTAGSFANFVAAFIIIVILTSSSTVFVGTRITGLFDGFPNEGEHGLMVGDTIVSINGERLYYVEDFSMFMQLSTSGKVDLVVRRDGERIALNDFPLERRPYMIGGQEELRFGITFNAIEASPWEKLKFSCYQSMNFVRLIRVSLAALISGAIGLDGLSGPVGIVDAMNDIGQTAAAEGGFWAAIGSLAFFTAFIGVNLAVMNMLPIPALDGGRILFIVIAWAIEKVTRRRLDPKYEGYIHTGAFVLLIGLMVFILVNDVAKLFTR